MRSHHDGQAAEGKALVLLLPVAILCSCSPSPEPGDWTIPAPEGTRIVEHAAVPLEERTQRIDLVEDLVLGADDADPDQRFYQPTDVAIDAHGRLYVLDAGNHRVQVFDAAGAFIMTLGREGQGPGELAGALSTTVVGDRLLVSDRENARISVWSTDGEHLEDVRVDVYLRQVSFLAGVDDGYAVVRYSPFRGPGSQRFALGAWALDGTEMTQYIELPVDRTPTLQRGARRSFGYGNPRAYPTFAADRNGNVYAAAGDEYQVLALAPDGSPRWALRVAWQRPPLSQELRRSVLERLRSGTPDVTESEINFLDSLPSISRVVVDGRGRLYVYLYVEPDPDAEGVFDVPVDVYSPDGEHLFSGMIPNRGWRRAAGDLVYGAGRDRASGEYRVFRWRLVAPFE